MAALRAGLPIIKLHLPPAASSMEMIELFYSKIYYTCTQLVGKYMAYALHRHHHRYHDLYRLRRFINDLLTCLLTYLLTYLSSSLRNMDASKSISLTTLINFLILKHKF